MIQTETGAFWLVVRHDREPKRKRQRKQVTRYYFLPWLLSVIGLSMIGYQVLDDAIDHDDAAYGLILLAGSIWAYLYAKAQVTGKS